MWMAPFLHCSKPFLNTESANKIEDDETEAAIKSEAIL